MFLTKRQKEIFDYLRGYISRHGYAPTFDEIAASFGFTSKGTVYKHIRALKEKGAIRHEWNRARSIEVRPVESSPNSLGDSMIEEHIQDGDYVVVQEKVEASDGQTVVALVDDQEATIKKMYRRNGKIELRPANEKLETMMYNADRIRIQGVVVGVMRKYNGELS